ncbi:adenylyl-sulfate kinase [Chloroflexota bacterium]
MHNTSVSRTDRELQNGHRGFTLWFTGLPASGKTTLANMCEQELYRRGHHTYVLDGDLIRKGLNKDLGFSSADRTENIRRIGELANILRDCGIINMVAFISPYRADRQNARDLAGDDGSFIEVFVDCPLPVCEERDPKGLYKKARTGVIREFTGISAPYEPPLNPEIHLHTDLMSASQCVSVILQYLRDSMLLPE